MSDRPIRIRYRNEFKNKSHPKIKVTFGWSFLETYFSGASVIFGFLKELGKYFKCKINKILKMAKNYFHHIKRYFRLVECEMFYAFGIEDESERTVDVR